MSEINSEIVKALDTLGLPTLVTKDDIRKQYHYLAKKYHPDRNIDDLHKMEMINNSYELLISYINQFRYSFSDDEISRQFPGADYASRFKL